MRKVVLVVAFVVACPALSLGACPGASSSEALTAFNADPAEFVRRTRSVSDLGAQFAALAAAAVNQRDPFFGTHLAAGIGMMSADAGSEVGTALGHMVSACSDPSDPADREDKAYISINISPNMLSNVAANAAYGEALDGGQTAATGGGGGEGGASGGDSGAGGQTGSLDTNTGSSRSNPVENFSSGTATIPPATTGTSGGGIVPATSAVTSITRSTVLNGARSVSSN